MTYPVQRDAMPLTHPLCHGREQVVKQWGGGPDVNACVQADLRSSK